MPVRIKEFSDSDRDRWDAYVLAHPRSTYCHLSGWKAVLEQSYGLHCHFLLAVDDVSAEKAADASAEAPDDSRVLGLLPLVHLKHPLFGNSLVSMPYFDLGGIVADRPDVEQDLLLTALQIAKSCKARSLELRQPAPLDILKRQTGGLFAEPAGRGHRTPQPHPVECNRRKKRLLLQLPLSAEDLWHSFKAKLRSQIKKPLKEGLRVEQGGLELLDDFYRVFCITMRDLGSPVHSKQLLGQVLERFPDQARLILVLQGRRPLAAGLVFSFKDCLENPWSASLKQYSRLAPNMLLYWTMLETAIEEGCTWFDFGRSSPDEGTYRFKTQWGARPQDLWWYSLAVDPAQPVDSRPEKTGYSRLIRVWQKLPVCATRVVGPRIRKHISL